MAERGKALENLIRAYAGQMMRYMVLWDCEDAGYAVYRFVAEGENCPACDALDGRIFPISEACSGENLAPMHPNCDCGAEILDRAGNAVLTIGGPKKTAGSAEKRNAFTPLLRIPEDAGKLLREFWDAQMERTQNIKGPLSFLDWLTLGIPRGIWEGMEKRGQDMRDAPGAYHIGNWLTMGLLDTAKGALAPDEPLSLEHWLNSAAVAGAAAGAYELGKYAVGKKQLSKPKTGAAGDTADVVEDAGVYSGNKVSTDTIIYGRSSLDKAFSKYSEDFGIYPDGSDKSKQLFQNDINQLIQTGQQKAGIYRATVGTHVYDSVTRQWVFVNEDGTFNTAFKLSFEQYKYLMETGVVK